MGRALPLSHATFVAAWLKPSLRHFFGIWCGEIGSGLVYVPNVSFYDVFIPTAQVWTQIPVILCQVA